MKMEESRPRGMLSMSWLSFWLTGLAKWKVSEDRSTFRLGDVTVLTSFGTGKLRLLLFLKRDGRDLGSRFRWCFGFASGPPNFV
jgi:hypothetical protein